MQSNIVPYLRCPVCHSPVRLEVRSKSDSNINSGTLICKTCSARYPIFHGRPILLTSDSISSWKAPIDEIFGRHRLKIAPSPLSIARLARIGAENAVERAGKVLPLRIHGSTPVQREEDMNRTLRSIENKARYRMWGNWLYSGGREEKFLESLHDPGEAVNLFLEQVVREHPRNLLDILSGSGSAVASIVNATGDIEHLFALDRDLKCLWAIQRKFMYLSKSCHCDAIGGDARRLPFTSDSIAVITSMMGLQEVYSISTMLREIARVLIPGGCYILLSSEEPFTYDIMSVESYCKFAREVDLFSGHDDLIKTAKYCGLKLEQDHMISKANVNYFLSVLRKSK
jgi:uncharacterized protein YbaR (Trm112 family)/SAM-dependent methyltransferase